MKGALANIGESKLAAVARTLEQAGRKGEAPFMSAETPAFLNALREVIARITPKAKEKKEAAQQRPKAARIGVKSHVLPKRQHTAKKR
jgi:HPt (histidine-containing phosphotransfer) domain-containing protein